MPSGAQGARSSRTSRCARDHSIAWLAAYMSNPCHIELMLTEQESSVEKPEDIVEPKKKKMSNKRQAVSPSPSVRT